MRVHCYGKPKENYGVSVHRGKEQWGESLPKKREGKRNGVRVHHEKSNGVRVHHFREHWGESSP